MNDQQLDELLNTPLAAVTDGEFSSRVLARLRRDRLKEQVPFYAAIFICAAAVLLYVPLPQIMAATARFLMRMAALPAVSLAMAALVLTFIAERALANSR